MRVMSGKLENFASYENLEFNLDSKGLTLIQGPTGSGKSTLCDITPWGLFGRTSKGGLADEILSWPGDKITSVTLYLDRVTISRSRGPKAKDNDLMFWPVDGVVTRGKDIPDTQRLINNLLKIDIDLYLAGAYFHEFSPTAQFFTTTAKHRRSICEQLVDLSLAKKLQENIGVSAKDIKTSLGIMQSSISNAQIKDKTLSKMYKEETRRATAWLASIVEKEKVLKRKFSEFEDDKNTQIMALKIKIDNIRAKPDESYVELINALKADMPPELDPCKECGVPKPNPQREKALKEVEFLEKCRYDNALLLKERNHLETNLKSLESKDNTYDEQITALLTEENPHTQTTVDLLQEIKETTAAIEILTKDEQELIIKRADLDILTDSVQEFRSILIKNTISDVESKTNTLLSNHFDSEIKVELAVEGADKLEAIIYKDGNVCSFTQLSKGQRQILKLCFGISVMRSVSNHHGIDFKQIFFDEALDGLDDNMKMKAIHMLETLTLDYDSIYLVEHSETVKAHVNNKYEVKLVDGHSQIERI